MVLADDGGTANSGDDTYDTQTFTITVNTVDDAPTVGNALADITVDEDASNTGVDLSNVFTDVDNDDSGITKAILTNNNTDLVSATISGNTLTLDYQENQCGTATITVRATSNGKTVDEELTVTVNCIDDAPTVANAVADFTVLEDASNTTIDYSNVFTDGDNDDGDITKTILSNNNTDLVSASISGNTVTLDYVADQYGTATITIRGTSNGETVDDAFVVTVTGVNDEPSFTKGSKVTVNEDAGAQTVSGWASSVSKGTNDPSSQSLTFTVTNDNNSFFSAQPAISASGDLTFTSAANVNGDEVIHVVLTDDGGTANSGDDTYRQINFHIVVNNVNDAPTDLASSNTTAGGGDAANTFIGNLTATDVDDNTHTFTIKSGKDGAKFKIVDGTKLYTNAEMVYADQPYELDIIAADDDDATYEKEITINVTDNNAQPVVTSNQTFTIAENAGTGTTVSGNSGVIAASDADGDNLSSWTIVSGNDAGKFALNASTGTITTAGALDYESTTSYTLTVKVNDGSVFSATNTITINVTDINDIAPVVVDTSFSINENVASGNSVGTPRATDADAGTTTFSGWAISSGNAAGKFAINASTGAITTVASVNHEETASYTLGITVSDGTNTSSAGTISIAINDLNEKPLAIEQNITINEDATDVVITLASSDPDGDVISTYTITSISTDGTLKQSDDDVISSNNTNVTSSAKQMKFTPDANFYGTITYNFTVTDPGSLTSEIVSVTITIPNTDDPPTVANAPSDVTVDEDADNTVIDLSNVIDDVDNENANITFSFISKGDESIVSSSLSGKTLTLDFQENKNTGDGNISIIYRATSNSLTVDDTIIVKVNPVDDGPTVANAISDLTVNEEASNSEIDLSLVFTDIDNNDAEITPIVLSNNNTALVTTSISGQTLTLDYQDNKDGTAQLVIRGTSNGKTVNDTLVVTVNPVDDPPNVIASNAPSDVTVDEDADNTVIDLSNVIDDVDNENANITFSFISKGDESIVSSSLSGKTLTLDFQENKNTGDGNISIIYRATSNSLTVDDTIIVKVNPVDDGPTVANAISDLTVNEEASNSEIDLSLVFTDIDNNDAEITPIVLSNNNTALVTTSISGQTLTLDYQDNKDGTAQLVIRGTSNGKTVNDTLVVTVNPVDDPPNVIASNAPSDVTVDEDADNIVIDLSNAIDDVDNENASIQLSLVTKGNESIASAVLSDNILTLDFQDDQNTGADSIIIIYRATSNSLTVDDTIVVKVNPVDDAPTVANAINDLIVNEDADTSLVDLSLVFTDIDNDDTVITKSMLSNSKTDLISYTLVGNDLKLISQPDSSGSALIVIEGTSNEKTVNDTLIITVIPVDDAPTVANAINDISVDEDADSSIISLTDVFTDIDNADDSITVRVQSNDNLTDAVVSIQGSNLVINYQENQNGVVNLIIEGTSNGKTVLDTLTITINPVNDLPIVVSKQFQIKEDSTQVFVFEGSDIDGDTIIFKVLSLPKNGILMQSDGTPIINSPSSITDNGNSLIYKPNVSFFGNDSILFNASDPFISSNDGKVSFIIDGVNDPPIVSNDTITIDEDETKTIMVTGTDPENDQMTFAVTSLPSAGLLYQTNDGTTKTGFINAGDNIFNVNQNIIYTPNENEYGSVNFGYSANDGEFADSAVVTININSVPDPPNAENVNIVVGAGLIYDLDLSSSISDPDGDLMSTTLKINSNSGPGVVGIRIDTTYIVVLNYSSIPNYVGIDSIEYEICDTTSLKDTGVIYVTVKQGRKPVALNDTIRFVEDYGDTLVNVLSNDTDLDGDLSASSLSIITSFFGEFNDNSNVAFVDTSSTVMVEPAPDYFGTDKLIYSVSDETGLIDSATLVIEITPVEDAPIIFSTSNNDTINLFLFEDIPLDFELIAFDADGDTLIYTLCDEPKYGYISLPGETADTLKKETVINAAPPEIQVNPEENYYGYYTFKYCVTDKAGNVATAVVTVNIVSVPDAPLAFADSITIFQTNADTINILRNDYDIENDIDISSLRIYGNNTSGSATTIPTYGGALASIYNDSLLIIDYSGLQMFFGEDSLVYTICDETELCDTATVIINVDQDQLPPDIYNVATDKDTLIYEVDDVIISASVKDSIPLYDVSLHVAEGGKSNFQSFELYNINEQSSAFDEISMDKRYVDVEQLIGKDLITINGLQYYFKAKDILGFGAESGLSSIPIKIPEGTISIDECIPGDTWVLISIPSNLDASDIKSVFYNSFGEINNSSFVVYTYEDGKSVEATSIEPGKSYFIYKKGDPVCDFSLGSGIIENVDTLEWVLKPGWNFVGNPYPFPFFIDDVSQIEYCGPLTYTGENAWSTVIDTVQSFGGYIICNKADTTRTFRVGVTPVSSSGGQIPNLYNGIYSFKKEGEWNVKVDFYTERDADVNNNAGFHPQALNEYDEFDNPAEPYTPDGDYRIRFDWVYKHAANGFEYPLRDDIRKLDQNEGLWYGLLKAKEEFINIEVDIRGDLKEGHELILFDLSNQERFNLIEESKHKLKNKNKTDLGKRIYLIYGDHSWVEAKITELTNMIPKLFVLNENYPNPFNPITTIKYEIPKNGNVRLAIYNIIGQEVITLVNSEQWAGKYSVRWNGTNQYGSQVATGTYFYVLKTNNNQSIKKMLLLK